MPRTEWGWSITADELRSWILYEDERLLAVNKPAHVVCHPSKHGEWSSLIGACRAYLDRHELHMPTRLDRETSGVVIVVKEAAMRRAIDKAGRAGQIHKGYHAVLRGYLAETVTVDQPIGPAPGARVAARRAVTPDGQPASTTFEPIRFEQNHTLVFVKPHTGRTHQIRVHAAWLGLPVADDKLYPDENVFLEFLKTGEPRTRQALHASQWQLAAPGEILTVNAPLPAGEWIPYFSGTAF